MINILGFKNGGLARQTEDGSWVVDVDFETDEPDEEAAAKVQAYFAKLAEMIKPNTDGPRPHVDARGRFKSDKYPTTPPGKVPLSVDDPTAQDLLWTYAQRRRAVDADFAADLEAALIAAGYIYSEAQMRIERDAFAARLAKIESDLDYYAARGVPVVPNDADPPQAPPYATLEERVVAVAACCSLWQLIARKLRREGGES